MTWTVERIETLKQLWAAGFSASQIAGRLGRTSRNAVIGKVHRLKLSGGGANRVMSGHDTADLQRRLRVKAKGKADGGHNRELKRKLTLMAKGMAPNIASEPLPPEPPMPPRMIGIEDLTATSCRYIYDDPRGQHGYCGNEAIEGLPYCPACAARCYATPKPSEIPKAVERKIKSFQAFSLKTFGPRELTTEPAE